MDALGGKCWNSILTYVFADPAEAQAINKAAEAAERMADEASKMTADIQYGGSSSSGARLPHSAESVQPVDGRKTRGSKQRPPGLSSLTGPPWLLLSASRTRNSVAAATSSTPLSHITLWFLMATIDGTPVRRQINGLPRLCSSQHSAPNIQLAASDQDVELLERLKDRRSAAESVYNALRRAEAAANAAAQVLQKYKADIKLDYGTMANATICQPPALARYPRGR
jgi:hypothetical protein